MVHRNKRRFERNFSSPLSWQSSPCDRYRPTVSSGLRPPSQFSPGHGIQGRQCKTCKITVVKFDGSVRLGKRGYVQQGAPWLIKVPSGCNVERLTNLVERKAQAQGVCATFVLTDVSGYPLPEGSALEDTASPAWKILAATRTNYEKHFGASLSLAEQLASSPPARVRSASISLTSRKKSAVSTDLPAAVR